MGNILHNNNVYSEYKPIKETPPIKWIITLVMESYDYVYILNNTHYCVILINNHDKNMDIIYFESLQDMDNHININMNTCVGILKKL
jgi:hypothetical protein